MNFFNLELISHVPSPKIPHFHSILPTLNMDHPFFDIDLRDNSFANGTNFAAFAGHSTEARSADELMNDLEFANAFVQTADVFTLGNPLGDGGSSFPGSSFPALVSSFPDVFSSIHASSSFDSSSSHASSFHAASSFYAASDSFSSSGAGGVSSSSTSYRSVSSAGERSIVVGGKFWRAPRLGKGTRWPKALIDMDPETFDTYMRTAHPRPSEEQVRSVMFARRKNAAMIKNGKKRRDVRDTEEAADAHARARAEAEALNKDYVTPEEAEQIIADLKAEVAALKAAIAEKS